MRGLLTAIGRSPSAVVGLGGGAALACYLLWRRRLHSQQRPALVLFDVDGTLAVPAQKAPDEIV